MVDEESERLIEGDVQIREQYVAHKKELIQVELESSISTEPFRRGFDLHLCYRLLVSHYKCLHYKCW